MKNVILLIIILCCFSCKNEPELDGLWIISKSYHKGKWIHPRTISDKIRIKYNFAGYEENEIIRFKITDSTALLPGFNSQEINVKFNKKNGKINFRLIDEKLYESKEYDITKEIFLQDFELITQTRQYIIELKSDSTYFKLIDVNHVIEEQTNNLFQQ
jgi:hypothetical protein